MRCIDVNFLVYAHRHDLREHEAYRDRLTELANDDEPLGLPDVVLSGFLRAVTDRLPSGSAPGRRHWEIFRKLAAQADARGNDIADAFLAAIAVENSATWLSADRGFARFSGVRWEHPHASHQV